jgi:hypothetical protein
MDIKDISKVLVTGPELITVQHSLQDDLLLPILLSLPLASAQ